MEQYDLPKTLDFQSLRIAIDRYHPIRLFIRLVGSRGGTVKVNEDLEGRKLDFKKNRSGLRLYVDSQEVFCFPLKNYDKGFTLAYERIQPTADGVGKMIHLSQGTDPYDPDLPEPRQSFLRNVLDGHLVEIFFAGRVHLEFHSWWKKPHWKYWAIVPPR